MADHHHHSAIPLIAVGLALAAGGAYLYRRLVDLDDHIHNDLRMAHGRIDATGMTAMSADAHIADAVNRQGQVLTDLQRDRYGPGPGPHD